LCFHCCFTLILLLPRGNETVFVYMCRSYKLKYEVVSAFCYHSVVLASGSVHRWASVFRICLKQLTVTQGLALSVMRCYSFVSPFVITYFYLELPHGGIWAFCLWNRLKKKYQVHKMCVIGGRVSTDN